MPGQWIESSNKVGELETRLVQLHAPQTAGSKIIDSGEAGSSEREALSETRP
jgi:hypothetical protein